MFQAELIIFDNDGVLVDSEPHAHPVLVELLRECGHELSTAESVEAFLGTSIGYVRRSIERASGRVLPPDFEDRYHHSLFRRFDEALRPIPGVVDLVRSLRVSYCVASSGSAERIRRSLEIVGLLHYFRDRMFSADDVEHPKPAPDLFLHAADALGVSPSRCVVVEDSPHGLAAAAAAGMESIGFAARGPAARLTSATLATVRSMAELADLLGDVQRTAAP